MLLNTQASPASVWEEDLTKMQYQEAGTAGASWEAGYPSQSLSVTLPHLLLSREERVLVVFVCLFFNGMKVK